MKVLHIGTLCNQENYEKMIQRCKSKPSIAPLVFETALIKGLSFCTGDDLSVISCPVVQTFPFGKIIGWKKRTEKITDTIECSLLPVINISGIKELCLNFFVRKYLKAWVANNLGSNDLIVSVYGVDSMAGVIQKQCRKYGIKSVCIVADLPEHAYFAGRKLNAVRKAWAKYVTNINIKHQNGFDGYVYLTEAMREKIAPDKPYCVIEGVADIDAYSNVCAKKRSEKKSILYAGTLAERYGIKLIIDSFELCGDEYELWICGSGDYEAEVEKIAAKNDRIRFFGRVSHSECIALEQQAHLLINIRNIDDDYTKYSFPSKNMEYALSGTPFASSKLVGIPDEYFDFIYEIKGKTPKDISEELSVILNDTNRWERAKKAQKFIAEKKSEKAQGEKLYRFYQQIVKH